MDSNSGYELQHHQPNSGLLRFRSASGSVLSNPTQAASVAGSSSSSSQPERLVLRFLNSSDTNDIAASPPSLREFEDKGSSDKSSSSMSRMNSHQGFSTSAIPSFFMRPNSTASSAMDSSYGVVGSMGMDHHQTHPKPFNSDLLLRQSSFPVGHFSNNNISFQNGYDTTTSVGNYGVVNGIGSGSELSLSMNRMQNQISFSSRGPSSLGMSSEISKIGIDSNKLVSTDDKFSDTQHGELGNQVHTLSHHLSFPRTSSEMMFATENLLQFPDSVPCKIRAKRGYATHPRSIAERVRRTRISERMRKLQELVPNMDKQTSTADMLDLAVVYIKDLQKQFKTLSDKRAKCKCMSMQSNSN